MVDLHSAPSNHLRCALARRGQSKNQEIAVVSDLPVRAIADSRKAGFESVARALSKSGMIQPVVDLVGILGQHPMKVGERPCGVIPGVNALGHLSSIAGGLRVAGEVVKELRVR